MKYYVTVVITDNRFTHESDADIRVLWKTAITIMKCAKRHGYKARYIVKDFTTGDTLFWMYCRKLKGEWHARLNNTGKYGRRHLEI